jgi:hypothetical protein
VITDVPDGAALWPQAVISQTHPRAERAGSGMNVLGASQEVTGVTPITAVPITASRRPPRHNQRRRRGTLLAFDTECDRDLAHPEVLANQRRERRHGPAGSAGKDRAKCLGLLVISAFDRYRRPQTNFLLPSAQAFGLRAPR